jgi:hypothetical protein
MAAESVDSAEWGTAEQIFGKFGLSRGTLYKLADAGRIKSVSIKTKPNSRKGARLFSIESIREMLASSVS